MCWIYIGHTEVCVHFIFVASNAPKKGIDNENTQQKKEWADYLYS